MSITKELFRNECLQKQRKKLPNRVYFDAKTNQNLLTELKKRVKRNQKILFFIPLKNEADIRKTLQKLRKKHTILVPFMEEESFKMVPYRLPLKRKKFGIYEAGNSYKQFKNIDIAVVPAVGIDKNLKRVGFGKGMYDRFFARLRKKPYTVFVQRKLCYIDKSVCDDYDVCADVVIAGDGRLEKRKK